MRSVKAVVTEESPLLGSTDNCDIEHGRHVLKGADEPKDGDPVMAKRMHLILPAVGVGVGSPRPQP